MADKRAPRQPESETTFEAHLNTARHYADAANRLVTIHDTEKLELDPIYMLYFHATELALKAYLVFKGKKAAYLKSTLKHNLVKICDEAIAEGLAPGALLVDLSNLVGLLHLANKEESLRYFTARGRVFPHVHDARKTVAELIQLIENATGYVKGPPGPIFKFDVITRLLPRDPK
jgi:hypothetical protein